MMNFSKAFDRTLNHFEISGKWLSEKSGVSQQMISGFRRNQQRIYSDSMEKLLLALPVEAQKYFFESLLGASVQVRPPELREVVEEADSKQIANLLNVIALKISAPSKSTDELKEKALL